ncbi:hypothetical protein HMPREF0216_03017 [Clostridium celatum DSM 1785]|uniref:Uncharacterized protein n=1 Tax=Clostridium celatum DSM 1785 TaxID=545697 RepID=L1Q6J5_9CLOT|nr:hypothetical protein HMPREF0216_03017 [Clostridium celatum DSM 1785]
MIHLFFIVFKQKIHLIYNYFPYAKVMIFTLLKVVFRLVSKMYNIKKALWKM